MWIYLGLVFISGNSWEFKVSVYSPLTIFLSPLPPEGSLRLFHCNFLCCVRRLITNGAHLFCVWWESDLHLSYPTASTAFLHEINITHSCIIYCTGVINKYISSLVYCTCKQIYIMYLALLAGDGMLGSRTLYWSIIFSTNFCFSRRSSLSFSLKENTRSIRTKQLRGSRRKIYTSSCMHNQCKLIGLFW